MKKTKKIRSLTGLEPVTFAKSGAMLYQRSYEAGTHWERGQFIEFISSREEWKLFAEDNLLSLYLPLRSENYSQRSRVRIPLKPWFFQAPSFQLRKLENLLRWSFFTFINNRSSNTNYFIYTSHPLLSLLQMSPHRNLSSYIVLCLFSGYYSRFIIRAKGRQKEAIVLLCASKYMSQNFKKFQWLYELCIISCE